MKGQVALETLLIITAMISIVLLLLPVFFSLKEINDKSFEKLHLKNTANQLLYYCNKNKFTAFDFEINLFVDQKWDSDSETLIISSENFEVQIDFDCIIQENLEKGHYQFHVENQMFQNLN